MVQIKLTLSLHDLSFNQTINTNIISALSLNNLKCIDKNAHELYKLIVFGFYMVLFVCICEPEFLKFKFIQTSVLEQVEVLLSS